MGTRGWSDRKLRVSNDSRRDNLTAAVVGLELANWMLLQLRRLGSLAMLPDATVGYGGASGVD